MLIPLSRMLERVETSRHEADSALFGDLMLLGELCFKLAVGGMTAGIADTNDRHRYAAEYQLVRADGIGKWAEVLDDTLVGVASQHISPAAMTESQAFTQRLPAGNWQWDCVAELRRCLQIVGQEADELPSRVDLRRWFRFFVQLRNKTRGHGAVRSSVLGEINPHLEVSISSFIDHCPLFGREWVYLHRNLSGKYRVSSMSASSGSFDYLRRQSDKSIPNGVYVWFDRPVRVGFLETNPELTDFYVVNGGFTGKFFELVSYATGDVIHRDSEQYSVPIGRLPESETQGLGELEVIGSCLGNLPPEAPDYVSRPSLEIEIEQALVSADQRPIVTLHGSGGVGKTSLALHVAHNIAKSDRFTLIVWFSARDIDLMLSGPKPVRPQTLNVDDVAQAYITAIGRNPGDAKGVSKQDSLARSMATADDGNGAKLFIFDNFETMTHTADVFRFLDTYVRLPNKVLITTRHRDFRGDFPIEVRGMTEAEYHLLVRNVSARLGIGTGLDSKYIEDIYVESGGHPYVVKILLGEVARTRRPGKVERIIAGNDDILVALFERTYGKLSPAAQRAFLTLSRWRSNVPAIGLEAILLQSLEERVDVSDAIQELENYSLVESNISDDGNVFLSVPLVAAKFGQRKIRVSPLKTRIEADVALLHEFGPEGPGQASGVGRGFEVRVDRLFRFVARQVANTPELLSNYLPILEFIARRHQGAWLKLADLYEERSLPGDLDAAKDCVRHFLESDQGQGDVKAWDRLASICLQTRDIDGEVHALVELASVSVAPFSKISYAANRLNQLASFGAVNFDERQVLMARLADIMLKRQSEADATGLSRLAWLHLQLHNEEAARDCVRAGIALDPSNSYCLSLWGRLGM